MNEALLPCPFCGSEVEIKEQSRSSGYPSTSSFGGFVSTGTYKLYSIICGKKDGCWLTTARSYHNKEQLVREWNARAQNIKEPAATVA